MFEVLGNRFRDIFAGIRGEVRLTPAAVETALREIRLALLEADVNFKVVKAFVARVRERAVDRKVLDSLTPAQQVVGIVREELLALFGEQRPAFGAAGRGPQVVLLIGLQGSGKTTTAAKLAHWLRRQGRRPLLVSVDIRRPAAVEQLAVLGGQADLAVHDPPERESAAARARSAVERARTDGFDTVIVDTAGRLHVDDALMAELDEIAAAVDPAERLYVADAMTGQDAVRSAGEFHRRAAVTGIVLTKMDGDARGGAALSVVAVVGVPIVFSGCGERLEDLEPFAAERMVSRMLGMGDVLTLVDRAQQAAAEEQAQPAGPPAPDGELTLEDLRRQLAVIGRMGPLDQLLGMIPGMGSLAGGGAEIDPRRMARVAAIIDSMTREERRRPALMNGSRRKRVARGSGTSVEEVNRLLKQFVQMRRLLKSVRSGARRRRPGARGLRERLRIPGAPGARF